MDSHTISNVVERTRLARVLQQETKAINEKLRLDRRSVQKDQINGHVWKVYVKAKPLKQLRPMASTKAAKTSTTATENSGGHGGGKIQLQQQSNDSNYDNIVTGQYISKVEFVLHPTFKPSNVQVNKAPFEIQRIGWSPFVITVLVTLKHIKKLLQFRHELDFTASASSKSYIRQQGHLQITIGGTYHNLLIDDDIEGFEEETGNAVIGTVGKKNQKQEEKRNKFKNTKNETTVVVDEIIQERCEHLDELQNSKARLDLIHHASDQLLQFVVNIPEERHGMALGAYLAGVYRGNLNTTYLLDLYNFATIHLRYVILKEDDNDWKNFVIHWKEYLKNDTLLEQAYSLSKPLLDTEHNIDIFISHCWSDDGISKVKVIEQINADFYNQHGRYPRLWLDMFCMEQHSTCIDITEQKIQCLPLFLKAAKTMIVLLSPLLLTRLWCLVEIYTAYILGPRNDNDDVGFHLYILNDIENDGNSNNSRGNCGVDESLKDCNGNENHHNGDSNFIHNILLDFSITEACCGKLKDQELLLKNLEDAPGGLGDVEWSLHMALQQASKNIRKKIF